jgi:hypothetical protein
LHCAGSVGLADVVFDFDDAEAERFVVHEVADYEAEVALFGAGGHLQAAFGCVGEAVDFGEGHVEQWVVVDWVFFLWGEDMVSLWSDCCGLVLI